MDESIGTRLTVMDGTLTEIRASITSVEEKRDLRQGDSTLRIYPDLSAETLRRRREFDAVGKALARLGKYRPTRSAVVDRSRLCVIISALYELKRM
uniref:Uncharacterized protein n=1 Tax=Nothobranchius furzeri TaxID=105023 RepID=A0A8C6L8Q5_NOTFU